MSSALIKICGIKDPTLAYDAVRIGAHYIGIMTFSKSKRYVDIDTAKKIAQATQQAGGIPVAVFVNADAHEMQSFCQATEIDTVQLHGNLSRSSHHLLPDTIKRIYAIAVDSDGKIQRDTDGGQSKLKKDRDQLLFDHIHPGSGIPFQITHFQANTDFSYFLAGGLTPDNVTTAIQLTSPNAVDVSSGVEKISGIKDRCLIESFIQAVKSCTNQH